MITQKNMTHNDFRPSRKKVKSEPSKLQNKLKWISESIKEKLMKKEKDLLMLDNSISKNIEEYETCFTPGSERNKDLWFYVIGLNNDHILSFSIDSTKKVIEMHDIESGDNIEADQSILDSYLSREMFKDLVVNFVKRTATENRIIFWLQREMEGKKMSSRKIRKILENNI